MLRQLELQDQPPQYMGHGAYHGARLLPPVAGSPVRAKMQVMGGAGIVLHRTAVQALLKPRSPSAEDGQPRSGRSLRIQKKNVTELALTDGTSRSLLLKTKSPAAQQEESSSRRSLLDECIEMQVAGRWCWWNSDWAIAECLQMVGIRGVGHSLFAQVCGRRWSASPTPPPIPYPPEPQPPPPAPLAAAFFPAAAYTTTTPPLLPPTHAPNPPPSPISPSPLLAVACAACNAS